MWIAQMQARPPRQAASSWRGPGLSPPFWEAPTGAGGEWRKLLSWCRSWVGQSQASYLVQYCELCMAAAELCWAAG